MPQGFIKESTKLQRCVDCKISVLRDSVNWPPFARFYAENEVIRRHASCNARCEAFQTGNSLVLIECRNYSGYDLIISTLPRAKIIIIDIVIHHNDGHRLHNQDLF